MNGPGDLGLALLALPTHRRRRRDSQSRRALHDGLLGANGAQTESATALSSDRMLVI